MTINSKHTKARQATPENYRKPGCTQSISALAPSARELLGVLNNIEIKAAA